MSHHISVPVQDCLVCSDIHGKNHLLNILLKQKAETETVLFLGDYCDRGKDSFLVMTKVKELVETGKAFAIRGNHDQMFLDFLDDPEEMAHYYYSQGGRYTIESFFEGINPSITFTLRYTPQHLASIILKEHQELIQFIRNLPYTIEMGKWLFVHAGVKPYSPNWKDSTPLNQFTWIREEFYLRKNETGKHIMFGHTSSKHLPMHNTPIWFNQSEDVFGIDGGAGSTGCLNGVRIHKEAIQEIVKVYQNEEVLMLPL